MSRLDGPSRFGQGRGLHACPPSIVSIMRALEHVDVAHALHCAASTFEILFMLNNCDGDWPFCHGS